MKKIAPSSILLLFVLSLIWGTSFILMKYAMFDGAGQPVYTAKQVASLRILIAGLSLLPFALSKLRLLGTKAFPYLLIVGLIGTSIPAFLFTEAQQVVDSALSGMLNALTPLWTFLLGITIFGVAFHKNALVGVLIGLIGAAGLVYFQSGGPIQISRHALLIVLATGMYGVSVNTMKRYLANIPSITVSALAMFIVAPFAGIYALELDCFSVFMEHERGGISMLYIVLLAVFSTSIGLWLFNILIKQESALFASSVTYFMPIVAIAWGLLDGEEVHPVQLLCIALILLGVWYVGRTGRVVSK